MTSSGHMKKPDIAAWPCVAALGRQRHTDAWALLASQPVPRGKIQASIRALFQKKKKKLASDAQNLKLS